MSESKKKSIGEAAKEAWEKGQEKGAMLAVEDMELIGNRMTLRKVIASRVRQCRADARLTQEEISERIHVNALTYKGYENCRSDIPTIFLVRIADCYNVSMDYLVGRTDTKDRSSTDNASLESRIEMLEKAISQLTQGQA